MRSSIDTSMLAEMIKSKRRGAGLRQLSSEIGISPSTLSRIEQGNLPDIETYLTLCNWLEVSPEFFTQAGGNKENIKAGVISHLRADKSLRPETAEALIQMINLAYESVQKTK